MLPQSNESLATTFDLGIQAEDQRDDADHGQHGPEPQAHAGQLHRTLPRRSPILIAARPRVCKTVAAGPDGTGLRRGSLVRLGVFRSLPSLAGFHPALPKTERGEE